ncbi:MAG: hypothetical protein MSF32_08415 [Dysosmobacter sp.]|nr:hypothetical protein [Dysosmobacter sp.]
MKKSGDFFNRLTNVSIFGPLRGPKICRCAAQTPADAGFLQTFDFVRGGLRPLELPHFSESFLYERKSLAQKAAGKISGGFFAIPY